MRKRPIITMNAQFKKIRVVALHCQISALTAKLDTFSHHKIKTPAPTFDIAEA